MVAKGQMLKRVFSVCMGWKAMVWVSEGHGWMWNEGETATGSRTHLSD